MMKANVDQSLRKATSLSARGDIAEAERLFREVLARFPSNKRALDGIRTLGTPKTPRAYTNGLQAALGLYDQGRLGEALNHLRLLIEMHPGEADLYNIAGAASVGLGQLDQAVAFYDGAIGFKPSHAEAHSNRASALLGLQRFEEALESCDKAIALLPDYAEAYCNRGIMLKQLGRLDDALRSYDRAIQLKPGSADAHYNRANALAELKRPADAVTAYDEAIRLRPNHAHAFSNRGNALRDLRRLHDALDSYDKAIALNPDFADAHSNRGIALLDLKRPDDAIDACSRAVALQPASPELHYNHAVVLEALQRRGDALTSYDTAIQLQPDHVRALTNRGNILYELDRLDEAAASYARAIASRHDDAAAHYNLANVLQELGRLDEAVRSYATAIDLQPDHPEALSQLIYQQARMCIWADATPADLSSLGIATKAVTPFSFLAIEDDAEHHLRRARKWIGEKCGNIGIGRVRSAAASSRIRIGYFSADFHDHATMQLMIGLLEKHDKRRFEIHAFSYGVERDDAMRRRTIAAVDAFHEVGHLSDQAIADLAHARGIDIAIDLKGHTKGMRVGIFAHRAAPVQIGYLGYPGSIGADFIDYIVADEVVIPHGHRRFFAEKIITLPDSYQANDDTRAIAGAIPDRAALGLPEKGFVFCSFNALYKITPAEFDIWMRLLAKVDGSVLWLLNDNSWAEANLRREAEARGIDPDRLIFAEKAPLPQHLARHRCADLFLDSFNCNAHTTASDALWAGLPVLTKLGEGFAARVAGSLLHAVGLPELATETAQAYEAMALELALRPERLAALQDTLATNRSMAPLFDTELYARHLESAFATAHERHVDGLQPDHIHVARI